MEEMMKKSETGLSREIPWLLALVLAVLAGHIAFQAFHEPDSTFQSMGYGAAFSIGLYAAAALVYGVYREVNRHGSGGSWFPVD